MLRYAFEVGGGTIFPLTPPPPGLYHEINIVSITSAMLSQIQPPLTSSACHANFKPWSQSSECIKLLFLDFILILLQGGFYKTRKGCVATLMFHSSSFIYKIAQSVCII